LHRYVHRTGVGVIGWRQASGVAVAATLAPRDNHRRVVSRGRVVRVSQGFTAVGVSSVASDAAVSYAIVARISADSAASYTLRSAVSADCSGSYSLLTAGAVACDSVASYVICAAVFSDCSGAYSVGAGVMPSVAAIAAAVVAALNATTIPVDLRRVTGQAINGAGTEANPWGP